ncbi:MAG: hypothetical protein H6Q05_5005 [Acidobacteria bacterium]|nr:hypothetical protein [Acidobacteriota bacterium]
MAKQQIKIQIDFSYFGMQKHNIQYVAATSNKLNRTLVINENVSKIRFLCAPALATDRGF